MSCSLSPMSCGPHWRASSSAASVNVVYVVVVVVVVYVVVVERSLGHRRTRRRRRRGRLHGVAQPCARCRPWRREGLALFGEIAAAVGFGMGLPVFAAGRRLRLCIALRL